MQAIKQLFENVGKALAKVGTVLVDRRAQITALAVAMLAFAPVFGVSAEDVARLSEAFNGAVGAVIALVASLGQLVGFVLLVLNLINSWTKRPPSGLNF